MCGVLFANRIKDQKKFKEALNLMKQRGPDSSGISPCLPDTFLGHRRLSILDLSQFGNQPMKSLELEMSFNGEIYNFTELKRKHKLNVRSSGDSEVLFEMFKKFEGDTFKKLDGEFAAVFVDKEENQVYAARDPFGVKPLYYSNEGGQLIISSEIKPILHLQGKKELDREGFDKWKMFGYSPGDSTLFSGIKKILPGCYYRFDLSSGEIEVTRYYRGLDSIEERNVSHEEIRDVIRKAVRKRMVSDVLISCTLSGGLDSSIIAALMASISEDIKTYTVNIGEEDEDTIFAKKLSNFLGTERHHVTIPVSQVIEDLPKILSGMEEPSDKGSLIPSYYLGQAIKEKVTLIGEGADECFAGYSRHTLENSELSLPEYFKKFIQVFPSESYSPIPPVFGSNWTLKYDLATEIPGYHTNRIDKMLMMNSVEARVPFLDPKVVELAMAIPLKDKVDPEKKILREAFSAYVPKEIKERKKHALKIDLDPFIESQKEVIFADNGLFEKGELESIYNQPEDFRNKRRILWSAYLANLWNKQNFG